MIKKKKIAKKATKKPSKGSNPLNEYLSVLDKENLNELEILDGGFKVKLSRQSAVMAPVSHASHGSAPAKRGEVVNEDTAKQNAIPSPIAGVFYRSASPSLPPFVSEGDIVSPGKVLCIVEAMKVMNEITAEQSGRISKILVENGKPIEAGQELFILDEV